MIANELDQVARAYRRMAFEAKYRPAAPPDSYGNTRRSDLPNSKVLDEQWKYAEQWTKEEDSYEFWIGAADYPGRPAMVFAVEAARLICGAEPGIAAKLLRMAAADLERAYNLDGGAA